jgi:hypothetical protein
MSNVRINLAGPGAQSVHLDGEDISNSVARVDVQCIAGSLPRITVDFALASNVTVEGKTEVFMSLATTNLLRRAGWTPPRDSSGGRDPIALAPDGGKAVQGDD